nr:hypothetical protein [Tanacetum cinerariifolium]
MSVQLVELDKHVRDLKNTVLEKDFKISELEECVRNKDLEIEKCLECLNIYENKLHKMGQTNQTVHMIMPSKDNLYNDRNGIGFENLSYFEKAKDLRPTFYDEKVICLGYTPVFLTHSDEALEIEKFKRSRKNKIEFAYDYGNLNASYVNEKINFEDDYFQEIINPDFEKTDSSFQQTSSLKPYVPNVILEKIIIDLEDEVVSLSEKEKVNLEIIEFLKSKGFESSEYAVSESENQNENDCHKIEKVCDKEENQKVIALGMFKLNVSQCVSPIQYLDTFSSVRRPKNGGVVWKKKRSSNTSNVGLFAVSFSNLNKNVKQYSRKDLLACNNSHLEETSSAYMCNDAMNVSCDSRMNDLLDDNNFFIFDDHVMLTEAGMAMIGIIQERVVKGQNEPLELALMCGRMFPKASDKIEKYVGGLPDMIHESVMASKPKTMQDTIEFENKLMDKKIRTFAERQTKNKRKSEDTARNNKNKQQQNKKQNTGRGYTVGSGEKKPYGGTKPLCSKCNYHHDGPCAPKCHK